MHSRAYRPSGTHARKEIGIEDSSFAIFRSVGRLGTAVWEAPERPESIEIELGASRFIGYTSRELRTTSLGHSGSPPRSIVKEQNFEKQVKTKGLNEFAAKVI